MRTIGIGAGSAKCFVVAAQIESGIMGEAGPPDRGREIYTRRLVSLSKPHPGSKTNLPGLYFRCAETMAGQRGTISG